MKREKLIPIIILLVISLIQAKIMKGQDVQTNPKQPKVKFDLAGQITLGYATITLSPNFFLTFGGPSIKFGVNKVAINIGMFPSVKCNINYDEKLDKTPLAIFTGVGAQASYHHIVAGCVCYSVKNVWYAAPVVGYKF